MEELGKKTLLNDWSEYISKKREKKKIKTI